MDPVFPTVFVRPVEGCCPEVAAAVVEPPEPPEPPVEFLSAEQSIQCEFTLESTIELPAHLTIVDDALVLAAGYVTSEVSQEAADAEALAYLTAYYNDAITAGDITCEAPPEVANLLYYTLDSVVFDGPTPLYLPDSVTDLHLNLNPTDSFGMPVGKIGNSTQHIGGIHAQTIDTPALNLNGRSWTMRFLVQGQPSSNPVYGSILGIPGVFTLSGSLHTGNKILQITFSGGIATATCKFTHRLTTADFITISGANDNLYEGTYSITVIDDYTFSYPVFGSPATPETSLILKWKRFPDTTDAEWSIFIESELGAFEQIQGGEAAMGVWTRIVLRFDAVNLTFSLQQNDGVPEVIALPPPFDTINAINRLVLSPGSITQDRGFFLDEIYFAAGYLWSDAESTNDWNGGALRTYPAVPIPP